MGGDFMNVSGAFGNSVMSVDAVPEAFMHQSEKRVFATMERHS